MNDVRDVTGDDHIFDSSGICTRCHLSAGNVATTGAHCLPDRANADGTARNVADGLPPNACRDDSGNVIGSYGPFVADPHPSPIEKVKAAIRGVQKVYPGGGKVIGEVVKTYTDEHGRQMYEAILNAGFSVPPPGDFTGYVLGREDYLRARDACVASLAPERVLPQTPYFREVDTLENGVVGKRREPVFYHGPEDYRTAAGDRVDYYSIQIEPFDAPRGVRSWEYARFDDPRVRPPHKREGRRTTLGLHVDSISSLPTSVVSFQAFIDSIRNDLLNYIIARYNLANSQSHANLPPKPIPLPDSVIHPLTVAWGVFNRGKIIEDMLRNFYGLKAPTPTDNDG